MKKLTIEQRDRMIRALENALQRVRKEETKGLCSALHNTGLICEDRNYLIRWIGRMLGPDHAYLENIWGRSPYEFTPEQRYQHRKPWVEWMIQHLKETT